MSNYTTGVIIPSASQLEKAFLPYSAAKLATRSPSELPKSFRLSEVDIHNQGVYQQCLACAWAAVAADAYLNEFKVLKKFAPSYPYAKRVKQTYRGEGMMLDTGIQDCITYGIPEWQDMPFYGDYSTCVAKINAAMDAKALPQKALSAVDLLPDHKFWGYGGQLNQSEIERIKSWLMRGLSLIYVRDIHEKAFVVNDGKGNIKITDIYNDKPLGPHGMRLFGWTDNRWVVQNSWGSSWGDKGICYVPFEDIVSQHFIGITDYIAPIPPVVVDPPVPDEPDPPEPPKPPEIFTGFEWKYDAKKKKVSIHIKDKKNYDYTIRPDGKKTKATGFSVSKVTSPWQFTVYAKDGRKAIVKG